MKNILVILMLGIVNIFYAQSIDKEEVKRNVTDQHSSFYYPKLIDDFINNPDQLSSDSLKSQYLYYGKLYSEYYKKNAEIKPKYLKFVKLTNAKKYKKALDMGEVLLKNDPVNLVVLLHMITCYKNLNIDPQKLKETEIQAEILLKTIARYGDGASKEKSFKVISIEDEFALLNYLGINLQKYTRTSEKVQSDVILDIWTKNKDYKEDRRNMVYFSVFSNNNKKK